MILERIVQYFSFAEGRMVRKEFWHLKEEKKRKDGPEIFVAQQDWQRPINDKNWPLSGFF